ncbi:MAG: hypothetical protein ABIW94_08165 [Gemmatimonadaceae bacterium]
MRSQPAAQGLYDPAYEHDACGIGFVAHIHGVRSRDVVTKSLELLQNLSHGSAVAADLARWLHAEPQANETRHAGLLAGSAGTS